MKLEQIRNVSMVKVVLKRVFLILMLANVGTAFKFNQDSLQLFQSYLEENNIQLNSPLEKIYRYKIFCQNLKEIRNFNEHTKDVKLSMNEFSLLSKREFRNQVTNPDFLFVDKKGSKSHVNVNDPYNELIIDRYIDQENRKLIKKIDKEVETTDQQMVNSNLLTRVEKDLKGVDQEIEKEVARIDLFLQTHPKLMKKADHAFQPNPHTPHSLKDNYSLAQKIRKQICKKSSCMKSSRHHFLQTSQQYSPFFNPRLVSDFHSHKELNDRLNEVRSEIFDNLNAQSVNSNHLSNSIFKNKHRMLQVSGYSTQVDKDILKLPAYINWAEDGKTTKIKFQGKCRSCYAFSGLASIESAILIK